MKTLSNYTKILLGRNNNENIFLSPPSWDCGWYWGFGYLGNKNCHYHLDGLNEGKNQNSYDALKEHFGDSFIIKRDADIWTFCELIKTFYALKETAEILGRGGAHYTSNPCKDIIINKVETERINNIVLPQIFEEIFKILHRNLDSEKVFGELVAINLKGDTAKVIEYMKENFISTDDLQLLRNWRENPSEWGNHL